MFNDFFVPVMELFGLVWGALFVVQCAIAAFQLFGK